MFTEILSVDIVTHIFSFFFYLPICCPLFFMPFCCSYSSLSVIVQLHFPLLTVVMTTSSSYLQETHKLIFDRSQQMNLILKVRFVQGTFLSPRLWIKAGQSTSEQWGTETVQQRLKEQKKRQR